MKCYIIRHPHKLQKPTALRVLHQVIDNLGITLPIPAECDPVIQIQKKPYWEAQITHSATYINAVIRVHKGPAPLLEMPFLTIVDREDYWEP